MESVLLLALAVSGVSVAWNTYLSDRPDLKTSLKNRSKFFVCGVCQVFWVSFLLSLIAAPIALQWNHLSTAMADVMNWLITWQAVAMLGFLLRYLFLLVLESLKEKLRK